MSSFACGATIASGCDRVPSREDRRTLTGVPLRWTDVPGAAVPMVMVVPVREAQGPVARGTQVLEAAARITKNSSIDS